MPSWRRGHTTDVELAHILDAEPPAVEAAVRRLTDLALVWENETGLRPLTGVPEALGSLSELHPLTPGRSPGDTAALLTQLSPAARAMLEHVEAGSGEADAGAARRAVTPCRGGEPGRGAAVARTAGAGPAAAGARTGRGADRPARWAHHAGAGSTYHRRSRPPSGTQARSTALRPGAAFEAVRRVELLVDHWGTHPPVALRSGALAVRDLKAAAEFAQLDEPTTALVIEVAAAAGLLATWPDPDGNPAWTPTEAFDSWCDEHAAERWTRLARAWLDTERLPFLVGSRDEAGKTRNALDPELTSRVAPETRAMTLAQLAALPPGRVVATGTGPASVVARLAWLRPRRPPSRAEQVVAALVRVGHIWASPDSAGSRRTRRALVAGDDPAPLLTPLLPAEVDHVLIQADLTAVAPGPLVRERARDLHLVADVESRGQATVYRFTAMSVRRAFDAGWAAHEVHAFLADGLTDAGAAAADLPRRRRRAHVRHGPGRSRRGLPARRRRGGPDRAPPPPARRLARTAPPRARPCWSARRRSTS